MPINVVKSNKFLSSHLPKHCLEILKLQTQVIRHELGTVKLLVSTVTEARKNEAASQCDQ